VTAKPWPVILLFVVSTIVWFEWRPAKTLAPVTAPPPTLDPEVRLCDATVRRFLVSTTVVEVTRDIEIINRLNCDIAKRADSYQ
jgi:hypothetical protein